MYLHWNLVGERFHHTGSRLNRKLSEVVEIEAFRLAFLVVGNGQLAGTFGTGRLFLFQLALGLLLRFFRTLFLSCPFLLPLGGGCTTSHDPSKQKISRTLIRRARAQLPH